MLWEGGEGPDESVHTAVVEEGAVEVDVVEEGAAEEGAVKVVVVGEGAVEVDAVKEGAVAVIVVGEGAACSSSKGRRNLIAARDGGGVVTGTRCSSAAQMTAHGKP